MLIRFLITLSFILICFAILLQTRWIWTLRQARRRGLYPKKGKATMFHVRDLIIRNETDLAIALYMDIFKTGYREAKKAVGELAKNIEQKRNK